MPGKRAERRHHANRMKVRWRRIVRAQRKRLLTRLRPTSDPKFIALDREVGIRAGHPRHFCQLCKRPRYERHAKWPRAPEEGGRPGPIRER